MYYATPSALRAPGGAGIPLRISAVHRQDFTGTGQSSPRLIRYTSDLSAPYGQAARADVLDRKHPSYSLMSDTLLRLAVDGPEAEPPDLVVLTYAVPEVDPRRCVTTRLHQLAAADLFGFAVSDQGTAAPFTGLSLIRDYSWAGACRRAMLVVAEQAEVPYETPPGTLLPERDTAVAVLVGPAGPGRVVALNQRCAVAPSDVEAAVAAELAALPPAPGPVEVIERDAGPDGLVCTATWWALADRLAPGAGPHRTVLVDYEASLGYLSLLAVDVDVATRE